MKLLFLRKILLFSIPIFFLTIAIIVTDPFDYLNYKVKINIDRIHTVRRLNVADWAISEVSKIKINTKKQITTASIGDSRGRLLLSDGFEKGWKGRITGGNKKHYDLSFGGAQLNESISLLTQELKYLDSLDEIIITLPIDRILTYNKFSDRVKNSQFNSPFPILNYLLNYKQLKYLFYTNIGEGKSLKKLSEQEKVKNQFLDHYKISVTKFDKNLLDIKQSMSALIKNYNIIIIIPPYELFFYNELIDNHKKKYNYFLNKLNNSFKNDSIKIINFQDFEEDFNFIDPVHGFLKIHEIYNFIKNKVK